MFLCQHGELRSRVWVGTGVSACSPRATLAASWWTYELMLFISPSLSWMQSFLLSPSLMSEARKWLLLWLLALWTFQGNKSDSFLLASNLRWADSTWIGQIQDILKPGGSVKPCLQKEWVVGFESLLPLATYVRRKRMKLVRDRVREKELWWKSSVIIPLWCWSWERTLSMWNWCVFRGGLLSWGACCPLMPSPHPPKHSSLSKWAFSASGSCKGHGLPPCDCPVSIVTPGSRM